MLVRESQTYKRSQITIDFHVYVTRALIGLKPFLDQAIQTRKSKLRSREFLKNMAECCYFIKQLLYGLIQTLGKVARVNKKSAKNHSPWPRVSRAFHSRNFPACLDH